MDTIDILALANSLRAVALDLDRLARRGAPLDEALTSALERLGPRSTHALRNILRRRREDVRAALLKLEAAGRIKRTRSGWALTEAGYKHEEVEAP